MGIEKKFPKSSNKGFFTKSLVLLRSGEFFWRSTVPSSWTTR
jgi:hypothetical protein